MVLPVSGNSFWSNVAFWSAFVGWMLAQAYKFVRHYLRTGDRDFGYFVSTGGMPSAHSASVSALATAVGLICGFGSPEFAISTVVALIVMFDAQGVRHAAGQQARMVNEIVDELMKQHHWPRRQKLAELLGHTRHEVFAGMGLGIVCAIVMNWLWCRF